MPSGHDADSHLLHQAKPVANGQPQSHNFIFCQRATVRYRSAQGIQIRHNSLDSFDA